MTPELGISVTGSRFPCAPVHNSYKVQSFLGGEALGELLAGNYRQKSSLLKLCKSRTLCAGEILFQHLC